MYFKTLGYNTLSQAGTMASDLKIGHYLKVPPRAIFINQMLGTLVGCIFNYIVNHVSFLIYKLVRYCTDLFKKERSKFSARDSFRSRRQQYLERCFTTNN